jgi:proteasome beta subunit
LKKLFRDDLNSDDAATVCVQSLYDAADDDSATGGPDLSRKIFPVVAVVDVHGYRRLPEDDVAAVVTSVVEGRNQRPDGPQAPLH